MARLAFGVACGPGRALRAMAKAFPIVAASRSTWRTRAFHEITGRRDMVIVPLTLDSHSDDALQHFGQHRERITEMLDAVLVSGDFDRHLRLAAADARDDERLPRGA